MPDLEPPVDRPTTPRVDLAAADTETLVDMGVIPEPPPEPEPLQPPAP
jgi:hypothetical protein